MRVLAITSLFFLAACGRAEGPLPLGARAADCATCHMEQAEAFVTSAHARSDRSPVLEAMIPHARDAWGEAAADRCVRCHAPSHAQLLGDTDAEASVTCITCHAAVGNRGERDGLLVVDPSAPIAGPHASTEPTPAHATRQAPLLGSSSLCGTCHEVTGPAPFIEETLSEHRVASPEPNDPTCASCHLPQLDDGPIALGAEATRARRDHGFVGLDPPWGASTELRERARRDAIALLASALSLEIVRVGASVEIRLTNVGARHSVPTGVAFLRDVWVDVEIDERPIERVIELGDQPTREGRAVALITDADAVIERRLAYGETRTHALEVPRGASVVAHLRARAFREDVLVALELGARADEVPVLDVTSVDVRP